MEEKYNGWTNRETWAFVLHLENDERLYSYALDVMLYMLASCYEQVVQPIRGLKRHELEDTSLRQLGEVFVKHIERFFDEVPEALPEYWHKEIGSMWRIDYLDIGEWVDEYGSNRLFGGPDVQFLPYSEMEGPYYQALAYDVS